MCVCVCVSVALLVVYLFSGQLEVGIRRHCHGDKWWIELTVGANVSVWHGDLAELGADTSLTYHHSHS